MSAGDETSAVVLHENEVAIDETMVLSLLESQCPQWADLQLSPAGAGTDNVMYRLGDELLVRLPRTAERARPLQKEQQWLPRLAPHGDLKPANVLVRDGKLHAIIDFGSLSVGFPEGEHTTLWEMPAAARQAYRNALDIDDITWARVRARAIVGSLVGILYYWHGWPAFAAQTQAQLEEILTDAAGT